MIAISPSVKILLAVEPADMRKSFEGLSAIVRNKLGHERIDGQLFLFTNRRKNRLKVLFSDGSGLWVLAKRLDKGQFSWPDGASGSVQVSQAELSALIGGLDVNMTRKRDWYRTDPAA